MNIYSYHGIRPIIKPSAYIHPQAVIIGNVEIGEEVYIGPNAVIRGDWGKIIIKDGANVQENCTLHVSDEMIHWKTEGTKLYQELAREGKEAILPCEPFTEYVQQIPTKIVDYSIWDDVK